MPTSPGGALNQLQGSRLARHVALALGAALVIGVLLAHHDFSLGAWFTALDPGSARGPCLDPRGPRPLCDFANHYYPQGFVLNRHEWVAVPGFYYSPFFALFMQLLAKLSYPSARLAWFSIVAGASLALLVAPLALGWLRSVPAALAYGLVFASSLPVLHDLTWGQVSGLLAALAVGSFIAHQRGARVLSAGLLAAATAIKFFPGLFALYFLARGDARWLLWFATLVALFLVGVPLLFMGVDGYLAFTTSLSENLAQISGLTLNSPYTNFAANVLTPASGGGIDHTSAWYRVALACTLLFAGLQLWMIVRSGRDGRAFLSLMLGFATIPFVVRSSWLHYFAFLPVMQAFVLAEAKSQKPSPTTRALFIGGPLVSALIANFFTLFSLVRVPDTFYRSGAPFWATAVLLPALYVAALQPERSDAS